MAKTTTGGGNAAQTQDDEGPGEIPQAPNALEMFQEALKDIDESSLNWPGRGDDSDDDGEEPGEPDDGAAASGAANKGGKGANARGSDGAGNAAAGEAGSQDEGSGAAGGDRVDPEAGAAPGDEEGDADSSEGQAGDAAAGGGATDEASGGVGAAASAAGQSRAARDRLAKLGWDVTNISEDQAIDFLAEEVGTARQTLNDNAHLIRLAQQVIPHLDKLGPLMGRQSPQDTGGGQGGVPSDATASGKKDSPPDLTAARKRIDDTMRAYRELGTEPQINQNWLASGVLFDGDRYVAPQNMPHLSGIAEKLNAHREWHAAKLKFVADNMEAILDSSSTALLAAGSGQGGLTQEQVERIIEERTRKANTAAFINNEIYGKNYRWMFVCGTDGRPIKSPPTPQSPNGAFIPTPLGQQYFKEIAEIHDNGNGITDPVRQHRLAMRVLQGQGHNVGDAPAASTGSASGSATGAAAGSSGTPVDAGRQTGKNPPAAGNSGGSNDRRDLQRKAAKDRAAHGSPGSGGRGGSSAGGNSGASKPANAKQGARTLAEKLASAMDAAGIDDGPLDFGEGE